MPMSAPAKKRVPPSTPSERHSARILSSSSRLSVRVVRSEATMSRNCKRPSSALPRENSVTKVMYYIQKDSKKPHFYAMEIKYNSFVAISTTVNSSDTVSF